MGKGTEFGPKPKDNIYILSLAKNTLWLSCSQFPPSLESIRVFTPSKIHTRIVLNQECLNGLATSIVMPEAIESVDEKLLLKMLHFSNGVNTRIGLPQTSDLIIRTAKKPFFSRSSQKRVPTISEPALLVKNVGESNQSLKLLLEGKHPQNFDSINDFLRLLGTDTYLMLHDDNFVLQKQSLHGAIGRINNSSWELACATDTLHARGLADSDAGVPTIRINADDLEDLFEISPDYALALLNNPGKSPSSRISFRAFNMQKDRNALILLRRSKVNAACIIQAYQRVEEIFGEGSIMEFRSYPSGGEGVGIKFHVLDVDKKF